MSEITTYEHHGVMVQVRKDLKGKHRDYCLCWQCDHFTPDDRAQNCAIANTLYGLCVLTGITAPVWECRVFKQREAR